MSSNDPPGDAVSPARLKRGAYFQRVIEAAPFAVVTVDDAGTVVDANRGVRRLFGYDPAELVGQPSTVLVPRGIRDVAGTERTDADEQGDAWTTTRLVGVHADGHEVPLTVSVRPFAVGDRTVHTALFRERAAGDDPTAEELAGIASVVSHDLRSPLNVVEGYLALEAEANDSERITRARTALDELEDILEGVLLLLRDGRETGETHPTPFESAIREAWDVVGTEEATLRVTSTGPLVANPEHLRALLERLLENAVVHGPPAVVVTVGVTEEGFYVDDDGPGLPPDERDRGRLTEPGYAVAPNRTGLGLAVVQRLAKTYGWSVTFGESEAGGCRVTIGGVDRPGEM